MFPKNLVIRKQSPQEYPSDHKKVTFSYLSPFKTRNERIHHLCLWIIVQKRKGLVGLKSSGKGLLSEVFVNKVSVLS